MAIVENQMVEVKWNGANKKTYEELDYVFTKSGDVFLVDIKHLSVGSRSEIKYSCDYCTSIFTRQRKKLNKPINFCTHECSSKYNAEKYKSEAPHIDCLTCGKNFRIKPYEKGTAKFCSKHCLAKWQSETMSGENSPLHVERLLVNCDWCNSSIKRTHNKLKMNGFHFCNKTCSENWHKKIFIQNEDYKSRMKDVMIDNLTNGKIKTTKTKPHLLVNEILDSLGIEYVNEYSIDHYSIDIYLPEHNLFIEINGGYWHCDNRLYNKVETVQQLKRIRLDKSKLTYMKNTFGKQPLYLWEKDIKDDTDLCTNLIKEFIVSKGNLPNYHSFNYIFDNNKLNIIKNLFIPYMEHSAEKLNEVVSIQVKEKVSKVQQDKHITFSCDNCGKEVTQYRKKFENNKTHCCSTSCTNEYRKTNV